METASAAFPKSARVLRSSEFRKIYDNGVRLSGPLFAAFLLRRTGPEAGSGARLGITVPRAIGGAVERNRLKRRLRELFRHRHAAFGNCDIVVNPRRAMLAASTAELDQAFSKLMERSR